MAETGKKIRGNSSIQIPHNSPLILSIKESLNYVMNKFKAVKGISGQMRLELNALLHVYSGVVGLSVIVLEKTEAEAIFVLLSENNTHHTYYSLKFVSLFIELPNWPYVLFYCAKIFTKLATGN